MDSIRKEVTDFFKKELEFQDSEIEFVDNT